MTSVLTTFRILLTIRSNLFQTVTSDLECWCSVKILEAILLRLCTLEHSFFLLHHRLMFACHDDPQLTGRSRLKQKLISELSRDWDVSGSACFQECINTYYEVPYSHPLKCRDYRCKQFDLPSQRICRIEVAPHILMHLFDWPVQAGFVLNDTVILKETVYRLFAAIYQKGQHMDHFVARFRRFGKVYHYDGMLNSSRTDGCSRCSEIESNADPFPAEIPKRTGGIGPIRMLGFVYKLV